NLPCALGLENLAVVPKARGVLSAELLSKAENRRVREVGHVRTECQDVPLGDRKLLGDTQVCGFVTRPVEYAHCAGTERAAARVGPGGGIEEVDPAGSRIEGHWYFRRNSLHAVGTR